MKFLFLTFLFVAGPTHAQPVLNAKCAQNIVLRAPKGGSGVYFDRDCKVAYVLPPSVGQIELAAISKTSNLDDCAEIANLAEGRESISRSWAALARELENSRAGTAPTGSGDDVGSPLFPSRRSTAPPVANSNFDQGGWQKKLDALIDSLAHWVERADSIGNRPAATAQFSYQVQHQQMVQAYQKLNPNVTFQPITLIDSRLYLARTVSTAADRALYPAVLFTSVPGFSPGKANGEIGDDRGIMSGEAQSGQIGFSLMGICPYYDSAKKSFPPKLTGAELAANMVANIRYTYELQVARRYKMTYNLASMLRRIQTSESKGGFFSTSAINKLIVERSNSDVFDIQVESEDGRWGYDDGMAQALKAQLIDRALSGLNLTSQGVPEAAPQGALPKTNGADAAAKEIGKCPYVYCQIASGVLSVASAIFGSTETYSEYLNRVDVKLEETSEERKMLSYHGTLTFLPPR